MDKKTKAQLNKLITGSLCTELRYEGDSFPLILFDSRGLYVQSAWRVTHMGDIIIGSDSSNDAKTRLSELLVGRKVESVSVYGEFHDLKLKFDDEILFETFANSEDYEHWHLAGGPNEMIIAGPGRLWSSFL